MAPPEILFVGHGAERSGPPRYLLAFQRWLREQEVTFATILTRGGELLPEHRRLGPVRVLDPRWTLPRVAQQSLARLGAAGTAAEIRRRRDATHFATWRRAPVTYVNTVSPATLRGLRHVDPRSALIVHVHEMEAALRYQVDPVDLRSLLDRADGIIAASHAVADNLTRRHGIDATRIEVHHELVEPVAPVDPTRRAAERVRRGLPPDGFVVVGSGMTEWRKGPDLFVHLASALRARVERPLALVWVGGATSGPTWWPLDHEAHHLGVESAVRFVGQQEDPAGWFRLADAHVVTSREDAYPIAALESASAGLPIVTFDTGGAVEFVRESGGGIVVQYPHVDRLAEALSALERDPARRQALGTAAAAHVRRSHIPSVAAPAIRASIERVSAVRLAR